MGVYGVAATNQRLRGGGGDGGDQSSSTGATNQRLRGRARVTNSSRPHRLPQYTVIWPSPRCRSNGVTSDDVIVLATLRTRP